VYWDFSAGGHVDVNEKSDDAAKREVYEELGTSGQLILVSKKHFEYPAWDSSIFRKVDASIYKMLHNGPFIVDPKEVERVEFFSLPTIQKMINVGEKLHPGLV